MKASISTQTKFPTRIWLFCTCFRLINALCIRTAFAPDEHWQSLEVAHRVAFGKGHLTWEWMAGLRSYVHPLLFAAYYLALKRLHMDSVFLVSRGPLLLEAIAAGLTDTYVFNIARLVFNQEIAWWTLLCQLTSWFNLYCLVRTYSSSLESLFVVKGVFWLLQPEKKVPKVQKQSSRAGENWEVAWLLMAAMSVIARPPSALFWLVVALKYSTNLKGARRIGNCIAKGAVVALLAVLFMMSVDRIGYGRWLFVPWEFVKFNVLEKGSSLYGSHPWHWNFSAGFPTLLLTLLPAGLIGLYISDSHQLAAYALLYLCIYSVPAHKEFRFLLPALQLVMPYCGRGAAWMAAQTQKKQHPGRALALKILLPCIFISQLFVGLYFATVHQRGQIRVTELIAQLGSSKSDLSVLYLTPCHATPYFSHMHRGNVSMRFLDCSPPGWQQAVDAANADGISWLQLPTDCAANSGTDSVLSQRQCFELDPAHYLRDIFSLNSKTKSPDLLIGYASLMVKVGAVLDQHGYQMYQSVDNCWLKTDDDNECELLVYKLS